MNIVNTQDKHIMGDTIVGVQFGISNPDDIRKRSVVEVTTEKTYQSNQPVPNGVFDARFGVIENGKECPTCKQTNQFCPGHFGHITLARPVYLYQFFDTIEKVCNLICLNCSVPLLAATKLDEIKTTGAARFKEIRDSMPMKRAVTCPACESPVFAKIAKVVGKAASLEGQFTAPKNEPAPPPVPIQPEMVLQAFARITDVDCKRLGFDSKFARPEWMICTVLAVPPLTVRPSVVMDDQQRMEDDLTHKLVDIVRANAELRTRIDRGEAAQMIDQRTALLQYHVATYIDNDIKGMAPSQQRSGRPLRTLKSRFGAKTGRVRGNLMGKRVDFSARSVITPDATIDLDELGVPEEIAINLTFPEIVSPYNRERLLQNVRNGPDKHPGAKSVYSKRDKATFSLRYVNADNIELREGDIVHRHLLDGDIVLFNRQPSLHKASMEAHRVRVLPYSTFRLNVSATRPYNADFDGDEMNMHVPQSIAAATELRCLASVLRNIISPRTNSPIIQLFQDTMTGAYRISQPGVEVPDVIAMNILARIKRPFVRKNRNWTGAEIISAAFPIMNFKGNVTLENGQLVKGILKKSAFGSTSEGLVHVVYNDFGPERCGQLINDIQSIITQYNLYTGLSVGTSDLIADPNTLAFVNEKVQEGRKQVAKILADVHSGTFVNDTGLSDGEKLEEEISSAMKKVESEISKQVIESLPKTNRIVQIVDSGSKGGPHNITQMVALLSQQLIEGKRVQYTLQDRTLPHFARYDDGVESRGFVEHSFVDGLMPAEFFYHAQAGREGLIDTAVKTSDTGYIQRKLMKTMEDQHIEYDGTVRNVNGSIVQFIYGDDGVDTTSVEFQACNLVLMTMEDIYRNYALTPDDVNPFLAESTTEVPDMVDEIIADRDMLFTSVFRNRKADMVNAPVHLRRLVDRYSNSYATKTDLTPGYVASSLTRFMKEFPQNKLFHCLLRFYLAPKKSILVHRFSKETFDELMRDVRYRYIKSMVHAGEMVGALAAQSIGEPTTQLTLNTFHSAGTAKANATSGVPRIEELLGASPNPKRPSNTVYLRPNIASSQRECISKMKEIQKTTLRDVAKSVRIYYDPYPLAATTTVDEDRELLEGYEAFSSEKDGSCGSPWIMRVALDDYKLNARDIRDLTKIQTALMNTSGLKIVQCRHSDSSAQNLILRIAFDPNVVKNPIQLRFLEDKVLDTVLTGVEGIGRVFLREVKNEMSYVEALGAYSTPKEKYYVLDVEGTNLYDLLVFDGVDGTRTFSNDIHEVHDVFGIEAARLCIYEEINEVFASEKVNYHHLAVLVDTMTFTGRIVPVSRTGMKKGETGVLAKSSFEETSKIMFNAATWAESDNMRGVSANIMFGQKPPCGTGFVDILIDEARLPEGPDEEPQNEALDTLNTANQKLDSLPATTECRMEDILMEW
jgi:DNA-directed RNA polymerase II subunit RPB1